MWRSCWASSCYEEGEAALPPEHRARIEVAKKAADFDYLRDDIHQLHWRIRGRHRPGPPDRPGPARLLPRDTTQDWQAADLHHGLDSTLNIASNEIKYRADVVREYGRCPWWSACPPSSTRCS
jgi:hypothetical protein